MNDFSALTLAAAMIAGLLLLVGGSKLASAPDTRGRGVLMIVAALVLVVNVVILTI